MRKFASVAILAGIGFGLFTAASAYAPPVEGVPQVTATPRCALYGHELDVTGNGFAANSQVTVSAPIGRYEGPPPPVRIIQPQTVTTDGTGAFEAALALPVGDGTHYWRYQPRMVLAEGPEGLDGETGSSFDQVVIGTRKICRKLA
jgi:hypothetical protein